MKNIFFLLTLVSTLAFAASGTTDLGPTVGGGGGTSSPLTTKGDVWGYSTTNARVPVGTNGQVLTADSTQGIGVKWSTVSGTGTVTSVDATVPAYMTLSGNPITGAGTLAFNFATQTANKFFSSPNGSSGVPTFRSIVSADIPTLPYLSTTLGTANGLSVSTNALSLGLSSTSTTGALSSTDWNTFNGKFNLPSLTAGSVLFSDGSTIVQDNTNFNWDNTGKTLALGGVEGPPGTVPYAFTAQRTVTDPSGVDGSIFGIHYSNNTANNSSLNTSGYFEGRVQVDAGFSVAANAGVIFQAYRNNGAPDAGALGFLVGAFGGAHQIGTDAAATTDILAGVLSQVDISQGTANKAADFYGLAGTNGGTITTGQFGIYIEPPGSGVKDNWLSGKALIGGSSYASHSEILKVNGDLSATTSVTDTGSSAATVSATSNTTTNGSNTTLGINGVAQGIVQAGAENDKVVGGMNFAVTRGDNTDDGTLDAMTGANTLLFHNSGGAGVTTNVFGMSTVFFSQHGTATNLYDFYSERVPAGDGVVTNHYGVYVKNDNDSPVKNWLAGRTQMGGSSFSIADSAILDLQSTTGALLLSRMDTTARDALTASNGMLIYNTDTNSVECYQSGSWGSCAAGGGGANVSLSNLSSTAVNTDLEPAANDTQNLGLVKRWNSLYTQRVYTGGALSIDSGDAAGGVLTIRTHSDTGDATASIISFTGDDSDTTGNNTGDHSTATGTSNSGNSGGQSWSTGDAPDANNDGTNAHHVGSFSFQTGLPQNGSGGGSFTVTLTPPGGSGNPGQIQFTAPSYSGNFSSTYSNNTDITNLSATTDMNISSNSTLELVSQGLMTLEVDNNDLSILTNRLLVPTTTTAGGTTGAQTINKISGTVNFAALATSLVITDDKVSATSLIFAQARKNDTTCLVKSVVPTSGSFTINMTAACTAETSVGFFVLNQ